MISTFIPKPEGAILALLVLLIFIPLILGCENNTSKWVDDSVVLYSIDGEPNAYPGDSLILAFNFKSAKSNIKVVDISFNKLSPPDFITGESIFFDSFYPEVLEAKLYTRWLLPENLPVTSNENRYSLSYKVQNRNSTGSGDLPYTIKEKETDE